MVQGRLFLISVSVCTPPPSGPDAGWMVRGVAETIYEPPVPRRYRPKLPKAAERFSDLLRRMNVRDEDVGGIESTVAERFGDWVLDGDTVLYINVDDEKEAEISILFLNCKTTNIARVVIIAGSNPR